MRSKFEYAMHGLVQRLTQSKKCPSCGSSVSDLIDRKFPFRFFRCRSCDLLYRFPGDDESSLLKFYQKEYHQDGLTTDLPSTDEIKRLLASKFKGTEKDMSSVISIIQTLGNGLKILDFGANWGYTVFQLRQSGFDADGYEISVPRAKFASHLGIDLSSSLNFTPESFDVVLSSHVLEHVNDPLECLHVQLNLTKPGGFVVGLTPNGSKSRREIDFKGFHRHWNQVHPVLLSDTFFRTNFSEHAVYLASTRIVDAIKMWDKRSFCCNDVSGKELVFVLRK